MKVKCWSNIFIFFCALAMTGMVGVPVVKAACTAQGSLGIFVVPDDMDVGTDVNYFVQLCNESTEGIFPAVTPIDAQLIGNVIVTPACEGPACAVQYPANQIVSWNGTCSTALPGVNVTCTQDGAGKITMSFDA
ncbi:MAG: hypothetical protein R3297_02415, partial [Desulfobulbales bacterium]|nr:hypothetical protein [Desulfobulbales bacterium]